MPTLLQTENAINGLPLCKRKNWDFKNDVFFFGKSASFFMRNDYICDVKRIEIMMRLQKYGGCKVVLLFLVLAGCLLTLCVLYYNKEKEATLSDVQACVKGMLQQEMRTRAQIIQSTKKIYTSGKGHTRIFKPYPFYVTINVGRGEERFLMDSLSSMKNIAFTSSDSIIRLELLHLL